MATFNKRCFFSHEELPKINLICNSNAHLGQKRGCAMGKADLSRRIKKDKSNRKPTPVPTAISSRNVLPEIYCRGGRDLPEAARYYRHRRQSAFDILIMGEPVLGIRFQV